jgi:signal transduction histidine kinase
MQKYPTICMTALAALIGAAVPFLSYGNAQPIDRRSISSLEQRLAEIDSELDDLASYSLRSGAGSNGYRSLAHSTDDQLEWVQVDLGSEIQVDEIILVPTLIRDSKLGFQSEGFPIEFRILAGTTSNQQGSVIASFTQDDELLPRIAPLLIPCSNVRASWIRIEANRLSPRGIDEQFTFQLAELLVYSGSKNCALRQPVTHPEHIRDSGPWDRSYLTDGSVPYLMNAATGEKSIAYLCDVMDGEQPTLTIDLGRVHSLSQINIHAIDQSDTIPQSFFGDYGIPQHFTVESALQPDFSDSKLLLEVHCDSIYSIAPIMMWNIPTTPCRYVRLRALKPHAYDAGKKNYSLHSRIGFAEIELLENGNNVANGKTVIGTSLTEFVDRPSSKLADGRNYFGNILSFRDWLHQLARRHTLEKERPVVETTLNARYQHQKRIIRRTGWLAALLAVGIAFTVLIDRMFRMRHVARIKERFAADLHDELGANIHSIGMLSDLAQDAESQEEWKTMHERIWEISQRTGTAIRHCTNMLEAEGLYFGLVEDIHRIAKRITSNFEHEIIIEGEPWIQQLSPRTRVDLFLFYKECLINICRHAGASRITTHLAADQRGLLLTISDDGHGISSVPSSLQRRAKLMKAQVRVENPPEGGTLIALKLPVRKRILRPRPQQDPNIGKLI